MSGFSYLFVLFSFLECLAWFGYHFNAQVGKYSLLINFWNSLCRINVVFPSPGKQDEAGIIFVGSVITTIYLFNRYRGIQIYSCLSELW